MPGKGFSTCCHTPPHAPLPYLFFPQVRGGGAGFGEEGIKEEQCIHDSFLSKLAVKRQKEKLSLRQYGLRVHVFFFCYEKLPRLREEHLRTKKLVWWAGQFTDIVRAIFLRGESDEAPFFVLVRGTGICIPSWTTFCNILVCLLESKESAIKVRHSSSVFLLLPASVAFSSRIEKGPANALQYTAAQKARQSNPCIIQRKSRRETPPESAK